MIRFIEDMPENTLGFEAIENVTAKDYEEFIIPLVEAKLQKFEHINLLYYIGPRFKSFDFTAMWEDAKVGFEHLSSWKKIAVVTDVEWVASAVKIFAFTLPAKVKIFSNNELNEAKTWLRA